ncbi:hypothetical protein HDU79_000493 [Rhizoclosmatium sp. JEL0117]|nr:hypothetical protein HDU79_000493 [Rhizoclosmatium sp. JEL0117]
MATTNITFGIIGNYCYFPYLVTTGSYVTNFTYSPENTAALDSYTYYVYFSDLAAVVAIETINTLNIFPGVHINVKRFSDCGAYWPTVENDFQGATGGFASSIMMHDILEAHNDVVAVIGLEYSSTARGPAEVLSYKQIPYCSGCSQSPRLSNKNLFPYFWRPLPGLGMGTHIYQLLKTWGVKRVALVIEKGDDLSTQYAADIFSTLQKQGITILATPRITSAMGPTQVQYVRKVLMEVDARYIILCFQSYLGSVLYQQLSELGGVVDENHVWITYSRIALTATNSTTIKQYQNQRGIVYLQNPPPSDNTRWFQTFFSGMQSMGYASNSTFNVWEVQYDTFTANIFDCGMMLALGMKQVLQTVPGATREMLSNKALNGYANFSVFRDLGYEGLMGTPYNILNNNGDLDTPYQFYSFTGDYSNITLFGETNTDGTNLTIKSAPVFFNGSNVPPADGPPTSFPAIEKTIDVNGPLGITMLFYAVSAAVSILLCAAFTYRYKQKPVIKRSSLQFLGSTLLGLAFFAASIITFVGEANVSRCHVRYWTQVIGFVAIVYAFVTWEVEIVTGETQFAPAIVSTLTFLVIIIIPVLEDLPPSATSLVFHASILWVAVLTILGLIYVPKIILLYKELKPIILESKIRNSVVIQNSSNPVSERTSPGPQESIPISKDSPANTRKAISTKSPSNIVSASLVVRIGYRF